MTKHIQKCTISQNKMIQVENSLSSEIHEEANHSFCSNKSHSLFAKQNKHYKAKNITKQKLHNICYKKLIRQLHTFRFNNIGTDDKRKNKYIEWMRLHQEVKDTFLNKYCQLLNWMGSESNNYFCENEKDRIINKIEECRTYVYCAFMSALRSVSFYCIPFLETGRKVFTSKTIKEQCTHRALHILSNNSHIYKEEDTESDKKQKESTNTEFMDCRYQDHTINKKETESLMNTTLHNNVLAKIWESVYNIVIDYFTFKQENNQMDTNNEERKNDTTYHFSSNENDEEWTDLQIHQNKCENSSSYKKEEMQLHTLSRSEITNIVTIKNNVNAFKLNESWNYTCVGTTCSISLYSSDNTMILFKKNSPIKDHYACNFLNFRARTSSSSLHRCVYKDVIPLEDLHKSFQPPLQALAVIQINDFSAGVNDSYYMNQKLQYTHAKDSSEFYSKTENTKEKKLLEDENVSIVPSRWTSFVNKTRECINDTAMKTYQYNFHSTFVSYRNRINRTITKNYNIFKNYLKSVCISMNNSIEEFYVLCSTYSMTLLENFIYYWCYNTRFKQYLKKTISIKRYVIFMCGMCITYMLFNFTHIITTFSVLQFLLYLFVYFVFSCCLYFVYCLFVSPKSSLYRLYRFCYKVYLYILRLLKYSNVRYRLFKFSISFWKQPTILHIKAYKDQWIWACICLLYIQCFIVQLIFSK